MADHEDYLPGEAPAAHKTTHQDEGTDEISLAGLSGTPAALATHALLPTVHQDAPDLIETHRLVPAAHHAKYTDGEARAVYSPISISPPAFLPRYDTQDWFCHQYILKNRASLLIQYFSAPIIFPPGVTVTKLTLYGDRNDALAVLMLQLLKNTRNGGGITMAQVTADWITGVSSGYDDSITDPVINNNLYSYALDVTLNPNDSVNDVVFLTAKIEFTG